MHSVDSPETGVGSKKAKRSLSSCVPTSTMPTTDSQTGIGGDDYTLFPVEDIVQYPLPGYVAPASVAFSPDDNLISYLYSPDSTLSRKIFAFDPVLRQQRLLVTPPGGGVDEGNLSTAEKLRRERLRERGLGVTRYEWAKSGFAPRLMVPLPGGVRFQRSQTYHCIILSLSCHPRKLLRFCACNGYGSSAISFCYLDDLILPCRSCRQGLALSHHSVQFLNGCVLHG